MKVHIRKKKLSSGGHTYLLDYFHNGERVREYLNIHIHPGQFDAKEKKILVEQLRSQKELDLASESHGRVSPHKKNIDFFAFFELFIKRTSRKDPRVFTASLNQLRLFHKRPTLPASQINKAFCQEFRNFLGKNLKGETPFNYFCVFRRVLTEAKVHNIFSSNPAEGTINKKPVVRGVNKEVLTDSELKILFSTPCFNDQVKRAFLFACLTGLRSVDIRALRWKNVDLKNKMLRIRQSKTDVVISPPLNSSAILLLGEEGKPNDLIFTLKTQEGINKALKLWVVKTGIKKHITFHCGRHTFATSLLVHGADLKTTSELMGHTTTRETEKYTYISEKMKRKAVDALPELS